MRHLLLILLIFGAATATAQKITVSGFTVKRELPANVNDWKVGDVNAVAKSSNPQGGEKEARMVIQVKRGNSKVCGNDVQSASYENVTTKVISIRDVQAALGDCQLPPGQYSLCIQFLNIDKYDISGEQCREFTVAEPVKHEDPTVTTNQGNPSNPDNPSNPRTPATQVTLGTQAPKKYRRPDLIAPANDAKLKPEELKKPVTLRWTPVIPMPPNNDIAYTVVIFEVKGDQSDIQAMRSNPPIFEKEVRTTQAIWQVPAEYSSSKESIRFAWNVKATNREGNPYGENGGMSETWGFSLRSGGCNAEFIILKDSISCKGIANGINTYRVCGTYTGNASNLCDIIFYDNVNNPNFSFILNDMNGGTITNITVSPSVTAAQLVQPGEVIRLCFDIATNNPSINIYATGLCRDGHENTPAYRNFANDNDTAKLPPCICTSCDSVKITVSDSSPDISGGIAQFTSSINVSPKKVKKVTADIVYFSHKPENDDCLLCNTDSKDFGNIVSATLTDGDFTAVPLQYSSEAVWNSSNPNGAMLNGNVSIKVSLPSIVKCCKQRVRFCVRYSFTLEDCTTCEKVICYSSN